MRSKKSSAKSRRGWRDRGTAYRAPTTGNTDPKHVHTLNCGGSPNFYEKTVKNWSFLLSFRRVFSFNKVKKLNDVYLYEIIITFLLKNYLKLPLSPAFGTEFASAL